jgi:hypothetical protein
MTDTTAQHGDVHADLTDPGSPAEQILQTQMMMEVHGDATISFGFCRVDPLHLESLLASLGERRHELMLKIIEALHTKAADLRAANEAGEPDGA